MYTEFKHRKRTYSLNEKTERISCKSEPISLKRQPYRVEILRSPGRPTIAAEFRDTTKWTACAYFDEMYHTAPYFWIRLFVVLF